MVEESASVVVVGDEVQFVVRLEGVAQAYDVGVAHFEENVSLGLGVLNLPLRCDHALLQHLYVELFRGVV